MSRPVQSRAGRALRTAMIAAGIFLASLATADNHGIVVVDVRGDVSIVSDGAAIDVRKGAVLSAPLSIATRGDGYLVIRQGETTIDIKPGTRIDIPAVDDNRRAVEQIDQHSGNAFYEVEKDPDASFKVNTPFLVSVVKGTAFSMDVDDDDATISLVEGVVEVFSGDDSWEMFPGDIAVGNGEELELLEPEDFDAVREFAADKGLAGSFAKSGSDDMDSDGDDMGSDDMDSDDMDMDADDMGEDTVAMADDMETIDDMDSDDMDSDDMDSDDMDVDDVDSDGRGKDDNDGNSQ